MAELKPRLSLEESINQEISAKGRSVAPEEKLAPLEQTIEGERGQSFRNRFPASQTLTVSPEQQTPEPGWGEVAYEGAKALPGSLARAAVATVEPILNPVETAKNIYGLGKGAVSKAGLIPGQSAEDKQQAEEQLNATIDFYKNRYGSMAGFKQALKEDPASVLMDASTLLGGAGLGAKIGGLSKASKVLSTTSKLTDPLSAIPTAVSKVPGAKSGLSAVADYIAKPGEARAGVAPGSFSTAFKAGAESGPKYDAFVEQMRGTAPATDIVDRSETVLQKIANTRKSDYLSGMSQPLTQKVVDLDPINKFVSQKLADTAHLSSGETMQAVQNALNDFQTKGVIKGYRGSAGYKVPDPMNPTIYDVDKLKQHISDLVQNPNLPGDAAASEVAGKIGQQIRSVDKGYADIMDRYGDATDQLKKFRYATGKSGQPAEARLAKIMKGAKDKYKGSIFDEMAEIDPDLALAIQGQSMAGWGFPSLMELATLGSAGSYFVHPAAGALAIGADILSKNPRAIGEMAYGLGKGAKIAGRAADSGVLPVARQLGYEEMRQALEERKNKELEDSLPFEVTVPVGMQPQRAEGGRVARASGGRIDVERGVRALMRAAENAKKNINKTTEPLLDQPDETIAQALTAAKKHI